MTPKSFLLTEELHAYLVEHGTPPDAVQQSLIERTAELGVISGMQIAPEQGAFLTMLVQVLGAEQAIEVGTFTGYSALCIARGLAAGGRLLCCDVSEEWTAIAREHWETAGVADRIDLRLAPALDTLRSLPDRAQFDFAFVDADKESYEAYVDELAGRVRPGGVIAVDNVLWDGNVVRPDMTDENTEAIRRFNDRVAADDRFDTVMLPLADGLTLLRRR